MKLSIITINFNNATELIKTINSVIIQTWKEFEFIIIDGGSTDGSVEIIKQNQDQLTYWVSEPDHGIFHAMNKGIAKANGEYLLMLNSGDFLCDKDVLSQIFSSIINEEDILAGDVYRAVSGQVFDKSYFPNTLTFSFLRSGTLSHQAAFIKRKLHDVVGLYDEDLKFASDWKFFILAICKYNATYRHLHLFTTTCDANGLTCDPGNFIAMKQENNQVLKQYFPAFLDDYKRFDSLQNKGFKKHFLKFSPLIKLTLKKYYKGFANRIAKIT
jgi:glycosyltransferase involved in cell wall biosynthesis